MGELNGVTVVVTGTAGGFGRAVEEAMTEAGAKVVGVSEVGVARSGEELLQRYDPDLLVITSDGGLNGLDRRLDPSEAFDWVAAALRVAASRGSRLTTVFAVSGEPVEPAEPVEAPSECGPTTSSHSMEPLAVYVAWEAQRLGVELRFVCVVVPPGGESRLVRRFQERAGGIRRSASWSDVPALVGGLRPVLTELELGSELVRLATVATGDPSGCTRPSRGDGEPLGRSYLLSADGLVPFPG